jgi:molybdate transport system substrate-binding protein
MKKGLALLMAAAMLLSVTACSSSKASDEVEVVVFAAASMTETLTTIAEQYEEENPNVTLTFNFDSSGALKTQIEEGAVCDVFISAGQKQMNQLDITADAEVNTDGLDFVEEGTRLNLLENKVTLVVPEDNEKNIQSFDDMVAGLKDGSILLAMGNEDVPVGQYTQKILAYYSLDEAALANAGSITYGSNVKEVTTQVGAGTVDCGVIYCTDAFSAGLTIVDTATADMCGQVIYPAAVMNTSEHKEEAQAFLDYLTTDAAMEVFESVGFSSVQ